MMRARRGRYPPREGARAMKVSERADGDVAELGRRARAESNALQRDRYRAGC